MSYNLIVRAEHTVRGREAEALCRTIGLPDVVPSLSFDMGCSVELPSAEIDRIVPYGQNDYQLNLAKEELDLLTPGDYHVHPRKKYDISFKIGSVWNASRMIALYDRVMHRRHPVSEPTSLDLEQISKLKITLYDCGEYIGTTRLEWDRFLLVGTSGVLQVDPRRGFHVEKVSKFFKENAR